MHGDVVRDGVMLREIIGQVFFSGPPKNTKLALGNAVFHPIKPHVHGIGPALFDGVGEDADSALVVELEWCGALGVAHFGECGSHGNGIFGIDEAGAGFGFLYG